jgi:hypothetical protein
MRPRGFEHEIGVVAHRQPAGRHLQQHVEQHLSHRNVGTGRQWRRLHGAQRAVVRIEGAIAGQRRSHGHDLRRRQCAITNPQAQSIGNPQLRRIAQRGLRPRDIEQPRSTRGERHVAHALQRHAHQHPHARTVRLHIRAHHDAGRDFVRLRTMPRHEQQQQSEQREEKGHREAGVDSLDRRGVRRY